MMILNEFAGKKLSMIYEMNYKVLLMPIAGLLLMNIIVSTATLTDGLLLFFFFWCRIFGKEKTKEIPEHLDNF
jgi:hypothetical protein